MSLNGPNYGPVSGPTRKHGRSLQTCLNGPNYDPVSGHEPAEDCFKVPKVSTGLTTAQCPDVLVIQRLPLLARLNGPNYGPVSGPQTPW